MRKLLLLLPAIALLMAFSPTTAQADDRHRHYRGKRNRNDGYDRYYNSHRGIERREYQGRRRYYRNGQYYYRSRDGYYPYGYRRQGGASISF